MKCLLVSLVIGIISCYQHLSVFFVVAELPHVVSSQFMFAIKDYTKDHSIRSALDWLQSKYDCCGFNTYKDYQNENEDFQCSSGKPQACGVPKSCCREKEGVTLPEVCGYGITGNATVYELVYTEGCTEELIRWLMEHLDLVGAIALGFAIPQIFGILLSYYFLRKVKEYRVWYRVDNFRT